MTIPVSLSDQRCPNGSETGHATRATRRSRITLLSIDQRLVFVWIFAWDKEFIANFTELLEYFLLAIKLGPAFTGIHCSQNISQFYFFHDIINYKLLLTVNVNFRSPGPFMSFSAHG